MRRSMPRLRASRNLLWLVACVAASGCNPVTKLEALTNVGQEPEPTRMSPAEIQVELMAFADLYTALVRQAMDEVAKLVPERRLEARQAKLRSIHNAIINAAGANPVGGLLDMTVMVTLQRQVAEEHLLPDVFGDRGEPIANAFRLLESQIWELAGRALDQEDVDGLRDLIPILRERFPDQVQMSAVRASDFAENRAEILVGIEGGLSLLQLFQLDPLASLTPASREIAQTRMLAERIFFWIKRMPVLMSWQLEESVDAALAEPEVQALVEASVRLSEASRQIGDAAEDLSRWLPEERAAAIKQATRELSEAMVRERDALIRQASDAVANERKEILKAFEKDEARLRKLLEDVRRTAEATTTLSTSLHETVGTTDRFIDSFRRKPGDPPPRKDRRRFDITEYTATAESTTVAVKQINALVLSLEKLLASPDWEARDTQIRSAVNEAEAGLARLIDRLFWRALVVVLVLVAASIGGVLLCRRLLRAPRPVG